MIEIDGSLGEGGGQVLRSSLTLAAITGQAFCITRIRARRREPGLKAQHLKAVEAAAAICGARVEGAELGSQRIVFEPGRTAPGVFSFDIGTAGSTSLVLQTILLPLGLAPAASLIHLRGGTHVRWSPCFDYLEIQWLPFVRRIGFDADLEMVRAGFYPPGGGLVRASIRPVGPLSPLRVTERGRLTRVRGISAVGKLDLRIGQRQADQAARRLAGRSPFDCEVVRMPSRSPGTMLLLLAEFERSQACFVALGERGKPAERVADEAVDELLAFLQTDGAVDPHLADQLVLPLALAPGVSELSTSRVTGHLTTNAEIVRRFLPARIDVRGEPGAPGLLRVEGSGIRHDTSIPSERGGALSALRSDRPAV
jgi:RNA 3'-terminal phosphate cyclase (ATP)